MCYGSSWIVRQSDGRDLKAVSTMPPTARIPVNIRSNVLRKTQGENFAQYAV